MATDPGIFAKKDEMIEHFKDQTADRFGLRIAQYIVKRLKGKKGFNIAMSSVKDIEDVNSKLPVDLIPVYSDIISYRDFVLGSDQMYDLLEELELQEQKLEDTGKNVAYIIRTEGRSLLAIHNESLHAGDSVWNLTSKRAGLYRKLVSVHYATPFGIFLDSIAGVL